MTINIINNIINGTIIINGSSILEFNWKCENVL